MDFLRLHSEAIICGLGLWCVFATILAAKLERPQSGWWKIVLYAALIDFPAALAPSNRAGIGGSPFTIPFLWPSKKVPVSVTESTITPPPSPPSLPPAAMVPFVIFFLSLPGCGNVMTTYFKSVSTAATTVSTGYRLLDVRDRQAQAEIITLARSGNASGAAAALEKHLKEYNIVRQILDNASIVVETAKSAAPLIEAAADKNKRVADWIVRLIKLAGDVSTTLSAYGIYGNSATESGPNDGGVK